MRFSSRDDAQLSVDLQEQVGGIVIARVHGELAVGSEPLLGAYLEALWERPDLRGLVVDVTEVGFCDSVGLGELIGAYNRCQAQTVAFTLAGVNGMVARLLNVTGLRATFAVFPDAEAATTHLAANPETGR
ncbi:anti-sigma factor antagonist [Planobispora longispora]|uniref:Anti-sigma factor antagonist n=1 Tax=Planobispora longispora TaxID=28887 RepID=A0A8J3RNW7_9ACTN|nr:anti-sigma factor antagonist [Planobispora longispora]BFE84369.1 hypothetical protein GCM10020093_069700 [Planobispora longispora]GIH79117.1 hypothetical protein Plo01_55460 [Planobispora longispora]